MPYNGIGIETPRGTGTSGHIVRNLSHFKPRQERTGGFNSKPNDFATGANSFGTSAHRQPDQGILDHERKRKVELECFKLREELEEKGLDEDVIEDRVSSLRKDLSSRPASMSQPSKAEIRNLRVHDTHALAAAKQAEMDNMSRALGVQSGYVEGKAFEKVTEEEKAARREAREAADEAKRERFFKAQEEKAAREAAYKEEQKKRRRAEYYAKLEAEKRIKQGPSHDGLDYDDSRGRSMSPPARGQQRRRYSDSRSRSPPPRPRHDSRDRYNSHRASPGARRRPMSRSPSPRQRRRYSDSRSPSSSRSRSLSRSVSPPPRRRRGYSSSRSRSRSSSFSRSPSPRRSRGQRRDRSPTPPRRARSQTPVDTRMRSVSPVGRVRQGGNDRLRSPSPVPTRHRRSPSRSRSPPRRRRRSSSFDSQSSFSSDDDAVKVKKSSK